MKKTVLGFITIVMLLVVILSTTVNAASLTTNKEKMEKGEIVTITITTKESVESMQFDLKFDTKKYQFIEGSIKTNLSIVDSNVTGDTLLVSAFDTSKTASTLTLQFKAIGNGESIPFTISNTEFSKNGVEVNDTVATSTVKVTVTEPVKENNKEEDNNKKPTQTDNKNEQPAEKDNNNQQPADTNNGEEVNTDNNNKQEENKKVTGKYIDENGKKITKLPQTGSYIPSIIIAVILLGIVSVIGYKMIKNK